MTDADTLLAVASVPDWLEQVVLRPVRAEDLLALEWEGEFSHFRRMYQEVYERASKGHAQMWLAELPGVGLVGQAFVQFFGHGRAGWGSGQHHAYVHGLRVRPELRGRGLGNRIMQWLEQDVKTRGYRIVTLNVVETNRAARRFYERRGYRVVALDPGQWSYIDQHGETQQVNEPGWRMVKRLGRR
ncbi:MAG: GNAT family N-acetyltransferase [Anaerolineae bacterium]|nr:MAG: GNAT family N-acetyltransferase [Anaerolineae bacterium]